MDNATVALVVGIVGTVVGSFGTKAIETINSRRKTNLDYAAQIRSEQRSELMNLRSINAQLGAEIEDVREKYYSSLQKNVDLESKIDDLQLKLSELEGGGS